MEEMIARCGLLCNECPAYIATKTNDDELRRQTAAQWSEAYGHDIPPEAVNCVGCLPQEGAHIGHCAECEIRSCAESKNVSNCGVCPDYNCERMAGFLAFCKSDELAQRLEKLHQQN